MNPIEIVLVASSVINVILLILVFITYTHISTMKLHISQLHNGLASLLGKMLSMEQVLNKVAGGFTDFVNMTGDLIDKFEGGPGMHFGQIYRTVDGKYTASSLEELISKIKEDNVQDNYISEEEMDKLKKLFEDDDNPFDEED